MQAGWAGAILRPRAFGAFGFVTSAPLLFFAAIHGLLGVGAGAFAAHAMSGSAPAALGWIETGARYQLIHAVAIAAIALSGGGLAEGGTGPLRLAGWAMVVGAAVFAGTLYAMAFGGPRWLGAVTPAGGLLMLAGWAVLGVFAITRFGRGG